MDTTAQDGHFDASPWLTAVSIEDDAGTIHEFAIPEGVCTHEQFLGRLLAEWQRRQPIQVHRPQVDSLADLLVMAALGFWTAVFGNLLFTLIFAADAPREWMIVPEGCVISAGTGQCVADFA